MVEDLQADGLLIRVDENYSHRIGTCWKCGTVIEPLPLEQWYVKVAPLTDKATKAVKAKKVAFTPKLFEKTAIQWLNNFHDWNISRQNVWGIRIPAWKCADCNIWTVTDGSTPTACSSCKSTRVTQDTDTFDTWFSSGQWPTATLKASRGDDFDYFYPTSVMETGYDILPWWVCRMLMLGLYMNNQVPFKTVYLHGLVRDGKGQKMSKSKGNVINPLKMIDMYGADALRFALVFGTAAGNDQALSEDKIRGMRNFANKLWNMARFIEMNTQDKNIPSYSAEFHATLTNAQDKRILSELNMLVAAVNKHMEHHRFSDAAQRIYAFAWHRIADVHLEKNKERFKNGDKQAIAVLTHVYTTVLKLLHPFMPFVTENIWGKLQKKTTLPLIISPWPVK
jgi:valyl-tRNA synthetase